ncbi:MAG: hypothetical protein JSV67_04660, partial [Thermoplasmatales archaeon]
MKKNISRKCLTLLIVLLLLVTNFLSVSAGFSYEKNKQIIKQSITPGDYFRFIIHDFRIRTYRIHIPPCYTGDDPLSVILILHGHPSNSKMMQLATELNDKADEEGFIAVYPDGEIAPFPISLLAFITGQRGCWWNAWDYNKFNRVDDVDYIRKLINKIQKNININSSRIYITGIS